MTRDDIIRMALEVGFVAYGEDAGEYRIPTRSFHSRLKRFAAFVAAAEREACAKVVENMKLEWGDQTNIAQAERATIMDCAIAIRARGEK